MSAASTAASALAHHGWSMTADRSARTAPGRAALMRRFELQVDPNGTLPADERARRAASARSAYYRAIAIKSAAVRQANAAARRAARVSAAQ